MHSRGAAPGATSASLNLGPTVQRSRLWRALAWCQARLTKKGRDMMCWNVRLYIDHEGTLIHSEKVVAATTKQDAVEKYMKIFFPEASQQEQDYILSNLKVEPL